MSFENNDGSGEVRKPRRVAPRREETTAEQMARLDAVARENSKTLESQGHPDHGW